VADDRGVALRETLRRESEAASAEAIQSGGKISPDRLERLQHLARLVEIHQATHPPKALRRWPVVATLGVTLLSASALLFLRVSATDIELDVIVSEVGFTLPSSQQLLGSTAVAVLGVSGLRGFEFPGDGGHDARAHQSAPGVAGDLAIRLASDSIGSRRGTIDLAPITLPATTRVRVQGSGVAHQFRLSFEALRDSVSALNVHVLGPVSASAVGSPSDRLDLAAPRVVVLTPHSGDLDLDLTFRTPIGSPFAPQLSAVDLTLQRVEQTFDGDQPIVRNLSTIQSGTIYLESLAGEKRQLRPGEPLAFAQSRGSIRALELRDDGIALTFVGRVRGMSTGFGDGSRSVMPTWLEWLKARHGLSLLWGTSLYLFGLILGVARWWRSPR